ncbi:MAG: hypothetical protein ABL909_08740 [Sphingopyxis sp.]
MTKSTPTEVAVQGTAIAIDGRAILFTGAPGVGKSDLALRCISRGAAFIADDLVWASMRASQIFVRAPLPLCHRIAIGEIGLVHQQQSDACLALALVIELLPAKVQTNGAQNNLRRFGPRNIGSYGPIGGLFCPKLTLDPHSPSAEIKVRIALERWGH